MNTAKLVVYQVDSFTKERYKGNPAGVVLNADGLRDEQMLLMARELKNSETAFLFSTDSNAYDGIVRYFTPTTEVPTCGHATIAAMYAKAVEERLDSCTLRMRTRIGVLPFHVIRTNNDYQIVMTQGQFEIGPRIDSEIATRICDALGLKQNDVDDKCPLQIATTGHSKVLIGIKSRGKLNSLSPNLIELIRISRLIKCNGYFVFTFDSSDKNILTFGRMFAPAIGIDEDPVTGNANGPLGGYIIHNRIVRTQDNVFEFRGAQGEAINRLGVVTVRVETDGNEPRLIQIKGDATIVFRTEMYA